MWRHVNRGLVLVAVTLLPAILIPVACQSQQQEKGLLVFKDEDKVAQSEDEAAQGEDEAAQGEDELDSTYLVVTRGRNVPITVYAQRGGKFVKVYTIRKRLELMLDNADTVEQFIRIVAIYEGIDSNRICYSRQGCISKFDTLNFGTENYYIDMNLYYENGQFNDKKFYKYFSDLVG